MKPEFHEDYHNPQSSSLDLAQRSDFNWDELYRKLGEGENASSETPEQVVLTAFRCIFDWVLDTKYDIKSHQLTPDVIIGRRFVALAWVMNPDLFPGSPSLNQLSRQLGVTAPILAALTGDVCREFGIQNRAQAHAWNRAESSD